MIHLGKESKLSPTKVLEKAVEFFGPGGVGLEVKEQDEGCARFEGGGGYVFVRVCEEGPALSGVEGKGTEVDLEAREWEYQAKQFMGKI
jgi:hypothetical protein